MGTLAIMVCAAVVLARDGWKTDAIVALLTAVVAVTGTAHVALHRSTRNEQQIAQLAESLPQKSVRKPTGRRRPKRPVK